MLLGQPPYVNRWEPQTGTELPRDRHELSCLRSDRDLVWGRS
jgi:hypothetical protein